MQVAPKVRVSARERGATIYLIKAVVIALVATLGIAVLAIVSAVVVGLATGSVMIVVMGLEALSCICTSCLYFLYRLACARPWRASPTD